MRRSSKNAMLSLMACLAGLVAWAILTALLAGISISIVERLRALFKPFFFSFSALFFVISPFVYFAQASFARWVFRRLTVGLVAIACVAHLFSSIHTGAIFPIFQVVATTGAAYIALLAFGALFPVPSPAQLLLAWGQESKLSLKDSEEAVDERG